jgi:hypothetical protein
MKLPRFRAFALLGLLLVAGLLTPREGAAVRRLNRDSEEIRKAAFGDPEMPGSNGKSPYFFLFSAAGRAETTWRLHTAVRLAIGPQASSARPRRSTRNP